MLQINIIKGPQWNCHAEAIITFENEPNGTVHVLPIILLNYLEPSIQDGTKFWEEHYF